MRYKLPKHYATPFSKRHRATRAMQYGTHTLRTHRAKTCAMQYEATPADVRCTMHQCTTQYEALCTEVYHAVRGTRATHDVPSFRRHDVPGQVGQPCTRVSQPCCDCSCFFLMTSPNVLTTAWSCVAALSCSCVYVCSRGARIRQVQPCQSPGNSRTQPCDEVVRASQKRSAG